MIVYLATKAKFLEDVHKSDIEEIVDKLFRARTGHGVSGQEEQSWKSSLPAMAKVLYDDSIPDETGVGIEYGISRTFKRIDMLLSGQDSAGRDNLIIVELKQWQHAKRTTKDAVVVTAFKGGEKETNHPSYQSWSYAELLRNFNEVVDDEKVPLRPCVYLHNCKQGGDLADPFYAQYLDLAPLYLAGEEERTKLRSFIARHLSKGDAGQLIYRIDNGKIRPSRRLIDALEGMMQGKQEFVLIDDQKLAYETALAHARKAQSGKKQVVIIQGGPGTGKSVVAVNLLAALNREGQTVRYVSKNRAPRQVIEHQLAGVLRNNVISSLFGGSGAYVDSSVNDFDTLIVDEAHRLNEKSGLYGNLGDHQVSEIIKAARCSIFLIDEDQRVTWKDIGAIQDIAERAERAGAEVSATLQLESQFRCSGSDGYLAWLDNVLAIRPTANATIDTNEYDFRVLDSPHEVRRLIESRNLVNNRSRMVAGYCWDWKSRNDSSEMDVVIPQHGFGMQWNLASDEGLWITAPESVKQIGCIHTCQGLEVDYIGVIIGPDLKVRDGKIESFPEARSKQDQSIKGFKKALVSDPDAARRKARNIVLNTYRTLMTRGMKGCYVYCTDASLAEHLRSHISGVSPTSRPPAAQLLKVAEEPGNYDG